MSEQAGLFEAPAGGSLGRCVWCHAPILEIALDYGWPIRIEPSEHGPYALHNGKARLIHAGKLLSGGTRERKPLRKLAEGELRYAAHFPACPREVPAAV